MITNTATFTGVMVVFIFVVILNVQKVFVTLLYNYDKIIAGKGKKGTLNVSFLIVIVGGCSDIYSIKKYLIKNYYRHFYL